MTSFFGELKRRNVVKVVVAYAIVGWLLIEVASVLLPTFQAPEWVMRTFSFAVIAGFPLAVILAWAFDLTPQGITPASEIAAGRSSTKPEGNRLSYMIQGLILLAVGFLVVDQYVLDADLGASSAGSNVDSGSVVRLNAVHPDTELVAQNTFDANIAISRDGQHIAYIAGETGLQSGRRSRLYLRSLDTLEPVLLSEAARVPFFSPDGQWVGFLDDAWHLGKISRTGGPVVPISEIGRPPRGASWSSEDDIVFGVDRQNGLFRVSAAGGEPVMLTTVNTATGELGHIFPQFLPGERTVLFTILNDQGVDNSQIAVLDLETNEYEVLIQGGHYAHYTESGHIVYAVAGTLRAVPFDLDTLEVRGTPVPVLEGVATKASGAAGYAVSENGTLVYLTGGVEGEILRATVWIDRDGLEESLGMELCRCRDPSVSPDGTRVAFSVVAGLQAEASADIWVWPLEQRTLTRLTFGQGPKWSPLWSPDGERIAYWVEGQGAFSRAADGTGTAEQLLNMEGGGGVFSWSADGQIFFNEETFANGIDIAVLDVSGNRERRSLLTEPFNERRPTLSPDGRWLAYESDESGTYEIFVRPFPDVDAGKWQISFGGGSEPKWNSDGSQLFYLNARSVMAVTVEGDSSFSRGTPESIVDRGDYVFFGGSTLRYGMSPDGQRFLMMKEEASDTVREPPQIVVVQNWFEELNRLVPPSQ